DTLENFASMRTEELDRGFQVGKPPNMSGSSREPLDPKDKLSEFKVDHLVEPYFHLTDAESALIQELFETIHLNSEMTMFDILGFAFHERLENLKEIRPQFNDRITRSQGLLSAYCLRFYIGLQRSMPQHVENLGAINAFTRKFAFVPDQFLERVDTELRQLQEVVEAARIDARKPTPGQIKMLKESKEKVLAQITQTIIPIRMLFGKLLQCKGHYHLFLKSAAYYQGFEPLDHSNKAGRAVVVRYFDYVKSGFQTGVKEQLLGMGYDFDAVMKKELPFSNTPREKEMVAFGTKIASALYQMDKLNQSSLSEMQEAVSQGLDHQTWLVRRNLQSHSVNKTPEEFREQLFSNYALTGMLQAFLSDMLRLVEQKVYPKGTITTEACAFRLVHNMHMYMNMKKSDEQTPPSSLSRTTSSKFKAIVDRLEEMFTKNQKIFDFSIDDTAIQEGFFNHADWLGLLRPIEASVTTLLDRSLGDLRVLKGELIEELKARWSALSLEELQKLDVPVTREVIFQEGLKLMRPLWILSDMLALLQKRHYSEEAAIIPRELAEVMELDEIDEMRQKLIQDKTPAPPKPVAVEVAIEKPIPAPLPAPQGKKDEKPSLDRPQKAPPVKNKHGKKTKLPKAHAVVPHADVAVAPAPIPEEVQELAHLTKSRQILDRLQRMGFYEVRTSGSHHMMSGPQGGLVVVPENDDLPRGTRNGIVNQTAEALHNQPAVTL
ncbi:MAG TPA: type II toxin-antitoxin system HicA family toxin, partial [Rhabdochlamydiaceae bacterium]